MTINKSIENEVHILELDGRLDTNTSPILENELNSVFETAKKITMDFSKLDYVSSAGLRVLLLGQKTSKEKNIYMALTGVSQDIMEVFEMTGFSDLLNIE